MRWSPGLVALTSAAVYGDRQRRVVRITNDPTQDDRDRYGRTLGYVNVASTNSDVGKRMIRAGWAKVYIYDDPVGRLTAVQTAQDAAHAGRVGVWRSCGGNFHRLA